MGAQDLYEDQNRSHHYFCHREHVSFPCRPSPPSLFFFPLSPFPSGGTFVNAYFLPAVLSHQSSAFKSSGLTAWPETQHGRPPSSCLWQLSRPEYTWSPLVYWPFAHWRSIFGEKRLYPPFIWAPRRTSPEALRAHMAKMARFDWDPSRRWGSLDWGRRSEPISPWLRKTTGKAETWQRSEDNLRDVCRIGGKRAFRICCMYIPI